MTRGFVPSRGEPCEPRADWTTRQTRQFRAPKLAVRQGFELCERLSLTIWRAHSDSKGLNPNAFPRFLSSRESNAVLRIPPEFGDVVETVGNQQCSQRQRTHDRPVD